MELSHDNGIALIVATHDNDFVNLLNRKYYLDNRGLVSI